MPRRVPLSLFALALACTPEPSTMTEATPTVRPAVEAPAADPARDAILAASALPDPLPAPLPDDPLGVTIHRLSNGLTVYISTDRAQPRIAAWIAFRAGSRHDPPHSTGLAHYLEHMMFKGSPRLGTVDAAGEGPHLDRIAALYDELAAATDASARARVLAEIDRETQASAAVAVPNELDRLYAQLGITDVNAFTGDDMTVYTADVPSARLAVWAEVEAERLQRPVFRLFYPELEAVYEEKNMSLDAPDDRVDEAMRLALFPGHPYGTQPTIGSAEHLKTPAYAEMLAYQRRWYLPNNAAIALAGDIDPASALPVLERAFAGWRPGPLEAPAPGELAGPKGRQVREVVADGEQSVTLAFRTVPIGHPDHPAMVLLDRLIGHPVGGLLGARLLLSHQLPDAEAYGQHMREGGLYALTGVARDGQKLDEVERLLRGVVDEARRGAFTQADLDAALLHETIAEHEVLESSERRVERMTDAFLAFQPWEVQARWLSALRAVTVEDIARVARTYLGDDYVVVRRRRGRFEPPRIEKPKITPVAIDPARQGAWARDLLAAPAPDPAPEALVAGVDYVRTDMSCGPAVTARNTRSDLFSLILRYEVGTRTRPLLGFALELVQRSGAGELDAGALQRRLYQLGTTIDLDAGADRTEIVVTGVDRNLEESLRLLEQWLRAPKFGPGDVKAVLANTLSLRRDEEDDPELLAEALALYAALGERSPVLARPSDRQLREARGPALAHDLAALWDSAHWTLYFGPREGEAAAAALVLGAGRPTAPRPPLRHREVTGTRVYFLHKDTAQAVIDVVFPQSPAAREDRPFAELLTQVYGGDMSGLAFQEIREARGLAYRATAYVELGARPDDEAALVGSLGTQADKGAEALALLLDLMHAPALTEDRLVAARTGLLREYATSRISPRARPGWVQAWLEQGEPGDPRPWMRARLQALDLAALRGYAARFGGAPAVISVMGDRTRIGLDRLRALGEVVEVTPEMLFPHRRP